MLTWYEVCSFAQSGGLVFNAMSSYADSMEIKVRKQVKQASQHGAMQVRVGNLSENAMQGA
eukprot:1158168-Pelagomonas_calceolata.AAC.5